MCGILSSVTYPERHLAVSCVVTYKWLSLGTRPRPCEVPASYQCPLLLPLSPWPDCELACADPSPCLHFCLLFYLVSTGVIQFYPEVLSPRMLRSHRRNRGAYCGRFTRERVYIIGNSPERHRRTLLVTRWLSPQDFTGTGPRP